MSRSAPNHMTAEGGRAARRVRPRSALAELTMVAGRDPIAITTADDSDRLQHLLPERYLRMSESPFTFFRGAAALMAHDLGTMANSGIVTQLCGDAHIANFGAFASPERELVFDVNDFDETAPGPFEWDVLRLASSAFLAARSLGLDAATQRRIARRASEAYQRAMRRLAGLGELDVWYEQVPVREFLELITSHRMRANVEAGVRKARARDAQSAARKFTELVDGTLRFREEPPLLVRRPDLDRELTDEALASYATTLSPDRRDLLGRFQLIDVAFKAVGVGSVGTRCLIGLLVGHEHGEPLILQLKEAGRSVLEPFTGLSSPAHGGERVVTGQRLMQATSDIFLGSTTARDGHDFYWRQLRDMKFSPDLASMRPKGLELLADVCGRTLARAHARGGNRVAIAAYLGSGGKFADAVTTFGEAYADRADDDHRLILAALATGQLPKKPEPAHE